MLLPEQRALAYHSDLRWLGKIRGTARARYRDERLDLSGCGEKVRKLIADAVVADGIEILVKEVQLFTQEFDEKVEALATDDAPGCADPRSGAATGRRSDGRADRRAAAQVAGPAAAPVFVQRPRAGHPLRHLDACKTNSRAPRSSTGRW